MTELELMGPGPSGRGPRAPGRGPRAAGPGPWALGHAPWAMAPWAMGLGTYHVYVMYLVCLGQPVANNG